MKINDRKTGDKELKISPKIVHVLGRHNHGKTTLVVELAKELTSRGLKVGTIKHSSHDHELDIPGKDSHRHRTAGANPAAIITPSTAAVHLVGKEEETCARLLSLYDGCDLILVESHLTLPGPKLEVWRAAIGTPPLALNDFEIIAVVTDDPITCTVPVWPRRDIRLLTDRISTLVGLPL